MAKEDKLKALDAALGQIEKQFGKGSVMKLGDSGKNMNVQTVPTGSLSLDIALGLGGVPVSYTHLDVYKRQLMQCMSKMVPGIVLSFLIVNMLLQVVQPLINSISLYYVNQMCIRDRRKLG